MPFTLAHPAAVLPLRRVWRLRTAPLIIGAVVPDLPYYLPGPLRYIPEMHTFVGSLAVGVPLGLAVLLVIFLLRAPLTALLSARARWLCLTALAPFRAQWREWALAPLSILIGVWTHLLWDSFTHSDSWVVHRVAALSAPVTIASYSGPLCHLLQYLSSAFGLAVMAVWYWRLPVPPPPPARAGAARSSVGPVLMLVSAAAILIGAVQATDYYMHGEGLVYRTLNILLTRSLAWFGLLYLLAGSLATLQQQHESAGA